MAIVTYDYYSTIYLGEPIAETEFPRAEAKAERIIAQISHGRATEENFAALHPFQQKAVKDALCAQVEYYALMGTDISVNGDTAGGGWTVGKVSVTGGSGNSKKAGAASMVCAAAVSALEQTGLLNPQVPTLGEPYIMPWLFPWGVP